MSLAVIKGLAAVNAAAKELAESYLASDKLKGDGISEEWKQARRWAAFAEEIAAEMRAIAPEADETYVAVARAAFIQADVCAA
jgi:hypothetical protein